jgi:predicted GNAT family acetyltransferase
MAERPAVQAIVTEREPRRMVQRWVAMLLDVGARTRSLDTVVLAAADVDADAAALRDLIHRETLEGATAFVTHMAERDALRAGLTIERAADACWALINSLLRQRLVDDRGWTTEESGEWLAEVACATLLEPQAAAAPARPREVRVTHAPDRQRYEALVDGRPAGHLAYDRTERLVVLLRTDVDPVFDDTETADALVRAAVEDVAAEGRRRVVTVCPYATWWLSRHPRYEPLRHDR